MTAYKTPDYSTWHDAEITICNIRRDMRYWDQSTPLTVAKALILPKPTMGNYSRLETFEMWGLKRSDGV